MSPRIDIHKMFHNAAELWYGIDVEQFGREWLTGMNQAAVAEQYKLFDANPFDYFWSLNDEDQTRFIRWFFMGEQVMP